MLREKIYFYVIPKLLTYPDIPFKAQSKDQISGFKYLFDYPVRPYTKVVLAYTTRGRETGRKGQGQANLCSDHTKPFPKRGSTS